MPRSFGTLLTLTRVTEPPADSCIPARHAEAEVLTTDATWVRVTVLAWHRLEKPYVQRISLVRITWLVQLRLADGSVNWHAYDALCIRPVNNGSSSSSGKWRVSSSGVRTSATHEPK
jgi:hypothetical protein